MKKGFVTTIALIVLIMLSSCSPSEKSILEAISKTQALAATASSEPIPTQTPTPEPTRGLTPEQQAEIEELQKKLDEVVEQIEEAREEDKLYSGGLVKAYIETRIQIYEINKSLLEQQIIALKSGDITQIEINGPKPQPENIDQLLESIEAQKAKNIEIQAEIAKFGPGLIRSTYQSTLATGEYSLAILEHLLFLAKFGKFPSK